MRISDAERQRVVDELGRHCAAGRIGVDEFAGRLEEVLRATSLAELDHARRDLPMVRIADPSAATGRDHPVALLGGLALVVALAVVAALVGGPLWVIPLLVGWVIGVAHGRRSSRATSGAHGAPWRR